MNELVDLRLHHHIAQEIYRQQMLQRLPGNKIDILIYFCKNNTKFCRRPAYIRTKCTMLLPIFNDTYFHKKKLEVNGSILIYTYLHHQNNLK